MINCAEDPRVALQLTRYHSWPRLRDQSVGEHSCQIMRILLTVWPDCPRRVLVHAVTHDMGEMAGDIQYPYKLKYPELKPLMDRVEGDVRVVMGETIGMPPETVLSEYERRVFKLVEFIEMWEYGLHEIGLGNAYARVIAQRCILAASEIMESLEIPSGSPDVRPAVKRYVDRRQQWENQNAA
jgi:hypothetical protein